MPKEPWPIEKKFWANINKDGPVPAHRKRLGKCWVWTGSIKPGWGHYGEINHTVKGKYRRYRAHRVSWEIHFGPIPDNLCVLHKCDNTSCVRPNHLFLGTLSENQADKMAKGRYVIRTKNFKLCSPDGHVVEINNLAEFAREHGLNKANLHKVTSGKKPSCKGWTHAP